MLFTFQREERQSCPSLEHRAGSGRLSGNRGLRGAARLQPSSRQGQGVRVGPSGSRDGRKEQDDGRGKDMGEGRIWEREGGTGAGSGLAPHSLRGSLAPLSLTAHTPPPLRSYQAAQRLALRAHGEGGRAPQRPRAEVRAAAQVEVPREAARGRRERARIRHRSRAVCPPCPAVPPRVAQSLPRRGQGRPLGDVVPPPARRGRGNGARTTRPMVHCERGGADESKIVVGCRCHQFASDETEFGLY